MSRRNPRSEYYDKTVPDGLTPKQLRSLLREFSLPTDGGQPALRARLQQKYLNWQQPRPEHVDIVTNIFRDEMTQGVLLKQLRKWEVEVDSSFEIEDLRRALTKAVMDHALGEEKRGAEDKVRDYLSGRSNGNKGDDGAGQHGDGHEGIRKGRTRKGGKGENEEAGASMSGGLRDADRPLHAQLRDHVHPRHHIKDYESDIDNPSVWIKLEPDNAARVEDFEPDIDDPTVWITKQLKDMSIEEENTDTSVTDETPDEEWLYDDERVQEVEILENKRTVLQSRLAKIERRIKRAKGY